MKLVSLILFIACAYSSYSQSEFEVIKISDDLQLLKITEHSYVYQSFTDSEQFGRFSSNGYLLINRNKALIIDTPMEEEHTQLLLDYLQDSMKVSVKSFIANHWHVDCMGGISVLHKNNIPTYAYQETINVAKQNGLEIPQHGFADSIIIDIGGIIVKSYFLGAAHSLDNIVTWIPDEEVLFSGCMVKSLNSQNLGNISDGDLIAYPKTLKKVKTKFYKAKIVIPGHGQPGGIELIEHTLEMALQNENK